MHMHVCKNVVLNICKHSPLAKPKEHAFCAARSPTKVVRRLMCAYTTIKPLAQIVISSVPEWCLFVVVVCVCLSIYANGINWKYTFASRTCNAPTTTHILSLVQFLASSSNCRVLYGGRVQKGALDLVVDHLHSVNWIVRWSFQGGWGGGRNHPVEPHRTTTGAAACKRLWAASPNIQCGLNFVHLRTCFMYTCVCVAAKNSDWQSALFNVWVTDPGSEYTAVKWIKFSRRWYCLLSLSVPFLACYDCIAGIILSPAL